MSFSIYKPVTKYVVGGGGPTNNFYLDVSIDVSGIFYTDICQYDSTYWQNVDKTIGKVSIADSNNLDAFGRFRVSNPNTLFDGKMVDSSQSILFDTSTNLGGMATFLINESAMLMDVSRANQFVIRQSHFFPNYQPGKSMCGLASFYFGTNIPAGVSKKAGLYDGTEGVYFEQTSTGLSWNLKSLSTGTTTTVFQNAWNIDKLDGSGPSGLTLSMATTNLLFIDFEWLGVGRVRTGFILRGQITYCHEFVLALDRVYLKDPGLPIRYEISTSSNQASNVSMKQICSTIISEGGYDPLGLVRSYIMENAFGTLGTSYVPILSIRLNPAYKTFLFSPSSIQAISNSGTTILYKALYNPVLTGASWQDTSSYVQIDLSATSFTGGFSIDSGFLTTSARNTFQGIPQSVLSFQSDINGTPDIFTIVARAVTGTNKDIQLAVNWREVF